MNILVAPDSFKGSLSAVEFCEITEKAILSICPDASVTKFPLADGGEGTVEALVLNTGGQIYQEQVTGPLGEAVKARYGILGDKKTAVIEMASAAGLALIPAERKNPFHTTTYGVGELILKAASRGCNKIIIGLGGSATNDGAAGVMQALGFQLLDKNKKPIKKGAEGLLSLEEIKTGSRNENLDKIEFIVACDVENPLLGKSGASYTYAQQKGAQPDQFPLLEKSLSRYNEIIIRDLHQSVANIPGAGAAGGMGAGLMAFLNATLKPGFDIIKDYTQIERCLQKADVVITGEGCIDSQTIYGKLPVGIGRLAKKHHVPVFAVVGGIGEDIDAIYENGITSIVSTVERPMELKESIKCADTLLYRAVQRLMRVFFAFKRGG